MPMDGELIEVDGLDLSMSWGSGGLVSTVGDMARLVRGMLTGDVLSKDTRHELLNNFGPIKGRKQDYGYAVARVEWGGTYAAGHVRRGRRLRGRNLLRAGQRQHDHRAPVTSSARHGSTR